LSFSVPDKTAGMVPPKSCTDWVTWMGVLGTVENLDGPHLLQQPDES
jgi:hypothetical protein